MWGAGTCVSVCLVTLGGLADGADCPWGGPDPPCEWVWVEEVRPEPYDIESWVKVGQGGPVQGEIPRGRPSYGPRARHKGARGKAVRGEPAAWVPRWRVPGGGVTRRRVRVGAGIMRVRA